MILESSDEESGDSPVQAIDTEMKSHDVQARSYPPPSPTHGKPSACPGTRKSKAEFTCGKLRRAGTRTSGWGRTRQSQLVALASQGSASCSAAMMKTVRKGGRSSTSTSAGKLLMKLQGGTSPHLNLTGGFQTIDGTVSSGGWAARGK